jgi:hypothetical protein
MRKLKFLTATLFENKPVNQKKKAIYIGTAQAQSPSLTTLAQLAANTDKV